MAHCMWIAAGVELWNAGIETWGRRLLVGSLSRQALGRLELRLADGVFNVNEC